ncbi:hypothetical protein [Streptomyces sp. Isolate_219]|nr:hypothetical protein [Streptomyces sp. Isolate_219]MCR8573104.1 hypothetical protein [Streptomyces sp. Isolate_219]
MDITPAFAVLGSTLSVVITLAVAHPSADIRHRSLQVLHVLFGHRRD